MPFRMKCPSCGRVGFVRKERVIDHARAATHYECGTCGYRWQESDSPADGEKGADDDADRTE